MNISRRFEEQVTGFRPGFYDGSDSIQPRKDLALLKEIYSLGCTDMTEVVLGQYLLAWRK